MDYSYELKIPKDRVAVLIGKKGSTKRRLEKKTNSKIEINTEGDVILSGEDNLELFILKNIVLAIGRGFNPEVALNLLDENYALEIININDFTNNKSRLKSLKSRLIGSNGRARRNVELLTNTFISIYGKTVSIIGKVDDVDLARRAVENLLKGAPHGNVYAFLEKNKKNSS